MNLILGLASAAASLILLVGLAHSHGSRTGYTQGRIDESDWWMRSDDQAERARAKIGKEEER